jgi:hypothetical protein
MGKYARKDVQTGVPCCSLSCRVGNNYRKCDWQLREMNESLIREVDKRWRVSVQ